MEGSRKYINKTTVLAITLRPMLLLKNRPSSPHSTHFTPVRKPYPTPKSSPFYS